MSAGMSQSISDPNYPSKMPGVGMATGNHGNARGINGVKAPLTREG